LVIAGDRIDLSVGAIIPKRGSHRSEQQEPDDTS
jgi:hypothetical protein